MAHSEVDYCGLCHKQYRPARHLKGHLRKYHLENCALDKDCKCPPLHPWCSEELRPERVHHPPKARSPIEESLPNTSTIVTHRAANGKPLSLIARIPVPAKGSATAKRKTVRIRSELLETVFERTAVPPAKQFKTEAQPDRVAQLTHLFKRGFQLLEMRSTELASIWPRQFTPKFHLLTYHMPQFARDWLSVGLSTEQCVEAAHPIINDLVRSCHGITHPVAKLRTIGKQFLLQSAASVADYAPPHRICRRCNLPIATTATLHCQCNKPPVSP